MPVMMDFIAGRSKTLEHVVSYKVLARMVLSVSALDRKCISKRNYGQEMAGNPS
jgi:hypothetical protein